jgi:hypothetical protein
MGRYVNPAFIYSDKQRIVAKHGSVVPPKVAYLGKFIRAEDGTLLPKTPTSVAITRKRDGKGR